jgi:hypothetical protein
MKKLSTYLFLILFSFSAPSFADDISDLQIEGISIGDSLLDYFSEEKITNSNRHYPYLDNEFYAVGFDRENSFEVYNAIEIHLKTDDKKYKIYSVDGLIFYINNIDDCYKKKNEIEKELSEIFKDAEKTDYGTTKHAADKSGKSTITSIYWRLAFGDTVSLECYDWSKEIETTKNWRDHLRISVVKKELGTWIKEKGL